MQRRWQRGGARRHTLKLGLTALAMLVLASCGTAPTAPPEAPSQRAIVFYPAAPAVPRIQHLVRLASARDLGPARSGFADFVAGKDTKGMTLAQPYGVALFDQRIFVADTKAGGLAVFDLRTRQLTLFTGSGGGRMKSPINITIDRDGTRYVTDTGRNQVLVYGRDDRFVRALGSEGDFRPADVAVTETRLYVVDVLHHEVHVLDKNTGERLFKFGKAGSKAGEFYHPTNIAIGADGDVYVAETGNYRIQRFTADGKPVQIYGKVGSAPGSFARPKGLALDRKGRMYVGDAAFQNVQIFDETGRTLMDFGTPREGLEGLNLPAAVKIDYEHLDQFRAYIDPAFKAEYLVLVVSQFGPNKVDVFAFGTGPAPPAAAAKPSKQGAP